MSRLALIVSFLASQYSPGVMTQVVYNRQNGHAWVSLPAELPHTDGYIAVVDCDQLGEVWWLRPVGAGDWESFLVVDCAHPHKSGGAWMLRHNIGVEVDHETAQRWGTVGELIAVERRVPVRPPPGCAGCCGEIV